MILRLLILWAVIASAIGLAVLIHRTLLSEGTNPSTLRPCRDIPPK
ncbi:MAG TPA: hypothetical protein VEP94_01030 [Solirubrobacterales bacterium]|jgi:hypothetical protein|nr:hypothetical protein [Solirubrobacterales bacterium]